jgi:hypothetical protein
MRWRATLVATSAVLLLAAGLVYLARPARAWQCHVTRPNDVPARGLYGNSRLAVGLDPVIEVTPSTLQADGWIAEQFPWRGYGATTGTLRITGHRLHGKGKPVRASISPGKAPPSEGASAFWATGIGFSTGGCWQVTGSVGGARLTFVTKVIDPLGMLTHVHRHRPRKLPF